MKGKQIFISKKFAWIISVIAVCFFMAMAAPLTHAATDEVISGNLADGTPYAVHKPTPWNGTIILDLDGRGVGGAKLDWMIKYGYAIGGTVRTGYDFRQAVDRLVEVRAIFTDAFGLPTRTIAWGGSRGGFVGRLAMEFAPDIFDAAFVTAGGGSGEIAVLNAKLDSLFVLKTLVNPESPMQIVGVPNTPADTGAETAALIDLVMLADSTPLGQARLALAAAVEQFAPWTVRGTEEPASDDYDAQYEQLVMSMGFTINYVFANPIVVRAPIEDLAGGVVSWNHGVNYTKLLARSGRKDFVRAMYKKAGASLMADLRTLAKAPRIAADPDAVAIAEKLMSYTGDIEGPVMNVKNTGDAVDPPSCDTAYAKTIRRAGNRRLLRNAWVHSPAHGGVNTLELITGFVMLIDRLDTGKWGLTLPYTMNKLAEEIAAESPDIFAGEEPRFVVQIPLQPLRTWDVSDWDTYDPEMDKKKCKKHHF